MESIDIKKCDVFSYGEIDLDINEIVDHFPLPERSSYVQNTKLNVGGAAANTSVWLSNWDKRVCLAGHVIGNDENGRKVIEFLKKYPNIDVQYMTPIDNEKTPVVRSLIDDHREHAFIVYWPKPIKVTKLTEAMLKGSRILNLDMTGPYAPRLEAAVLARKLGIPIIINDLMDSELEICELVNIIVLSAAQLRKIYMSKDPHQIAFELHMKAGASVFVTDSDKEVFGVDADGRTHSITPYKCPVIDGTGAGDAFKAGVIYGRLNGWTFSQIMTWASAAGSLAVQNIGATATTASIEEVRKIYLTLLKNES